MNIAAYMSSEFSLSYQTCVHRNVNKIDTQSHTCSNTSSGIPYISESWSIM